MRELRYAASARQDLADIFLRGLRTGSADQALAFVEALEQRCEIFLTNPHLGVSLATGEGAAIRAFTFDRMITVLFEPEDNGVRVLRLLPRGADLASVVKGART